MECPARSEPEPKAAQPARVQRRKAFDLSAHLRGSIEQEPRLAVCAHRDAFLGARLDADRSVARAAAVAAGTVPLRAAPTGRRAEHADVQLPLPKRALPGDSVAVRLRLRIHLDLFESGLGPAHGTFPLHPAWHHPTEREGRTLCRFGVPIYPRDRQGKPLGKLRGSRQESDQRAMPQARCSPQVS